jgi:hypothetical protein
LCGPTSPSRRDDLRPGSARGVFSCPDLQAESDHVRSFAHRLTRPFRTTQPATIRKQPRQLGRPIEQLEDRSVPSILYSATPVNDVPNSATIDQANTTENVAASTSGHVHVASGGNQVRVATSLNSGQSFQPSVLLANTSTPYVAVETQGANNVYVAWAAGSSAFVSVSTDGGATFSAPQTVTTSGSFSGVNLAVFRTNVYVESSNGGHDAAGRRPAVEQQ